MNALLTSLINDEAGFIVSAELVLVSTIAVLGMVVGLSEVSHNVNNELEDVGSAFASLKQDYKVHCSSGHKGWMAGSSYHDCPEFCDGQFDVQ
ncbi:branched-chain amino acid aminotransferase [Planctomicrobium sp. SH664]|uniref:branched-chain amino acid aminotransferase n=1 Tax=Planctomicrobium sp. SH664 TaxID=3448125 RepID=UPI003F5BF70C